MHTHARTHSLFIITHNKYKNSSTPKIKPRSSYKYKVSQIWHPTNYVNHCSIYCLQHYKHSGSDKMELLLILYTAVFELLTSWNNRKKNTHWLRHKHYHMISFLLTANWVIWRAQFAYSVNTWPLFETQNWSPGRYFSDTISKVLAINPITKKWWWWWWWRRWWWLTFCYNFYCHYHHRCCCIHPHAHHHNHHLYYYYYYY